MVSMKKTYYYHFFPTKQEEKATAKSIVPRSSRVPRTLVEIRDANPPSNVIDPKNPWKIRKRLESQEITSGKIRLSHDDVFEHVFRYAMLEWATDVVSGKKVLVKICDVSDDNNVIYGPYDDQVYFVKVYDDDYYDLALHMAIVRNHGLKIGDEVGIFYDAANETFYFKVFH